MNSKKLDGCNPIRAIKYMLLNSDYVFKTLE